MTCPSCGTETPTGARFCPSCGHALRTPGDERRVVTVVFGDIVGFTALSETRDPEHVKNLVDRAFARLADDIRAFGGTLDKVVGDGLVALFGAPVAHEDDAERAVRCALQMHHTLAAELEGAVEMRVGVNTGEVLVGAIRAGGDYTAMGDVVNTASRLQTIAEPGAVVVGADTYAATKNVFRYEPLGLVRPRGREAPVEAWVAREAVTTPGRRLPARRSPKLVGRDDEAAVLEHVIAAGIERRRPTLVVLVGEAGVGKSRLAEDVLLRTIARWGVKILSGRAVPYGAANAWWPIAEVMRAACGMTADDSDDDARAKAVRTVAGLFGWEETSAETVRIAEALLYLAGIACSLADVETDRARDEVGPAIRQFIGALAEQQPLVVTLADMQWADPGILTGFDELFHRLGRVPVVVLMTARAEVFEAWAPRATTDNLVVLNVDPLDTDAANELLLALLGHDPGPSVRAELVERSGGNPLFVEELAALVAEKADVDRLPATLRGIIAARLDALPAAERAVLDDAAVVGRRAPMAALLALGGSRGGVKDAVDQLVAHDLLVVDEGQCEFRSDLVREVVYGMLTKAERARRHAALAEWLDSLSGDPTDELLGERARHWGTAAELDAELGGIDGVPPDVRDRAIAALEQAAARAGDRELHTHALRVANRILSLLGDSEEPARRRALVVRARAATALRRDEAFVDLDAAEAEARATGDDAALGETLVIRGDALRNRGDYEGSLRALEEARAILRRSGDRRGEGAALRRIGWTRLFAGDLDGAEPVLHAALDAFRDAGALRGEAWAHQNLAWVAFGRGDMATVERELEESADLFRRIGDWGGLNGAIGMRGWVAMAQGRVADAEADGLRTLEEAREQDDLWQVGMTTVLLASVRLWQGRAADAVDLATEAYEQFSAIGDTWGQIQASGPLARALLLNGRIEEAAEARRRAFAIVEAPGGPTRMRPMVVVSEAVAAAALGDGARALDLLIDEQATIDDLRVGAVDVLVARVLGLLQTGRAVEAVATLGESERSHVQAVFALALAAAGETERARETAGSVPGGAYADRVMAAMATACAAARAGDGEAAREAADQALRTIDHTQDRLTGAIVAMARARVLSVIGDAFAGGAEADAAARLAALGIDGGGWPDVFRLAASGASAPA